MIGPSPAGRDFSVPVEVAEEVLEGIVVIAAVGVLTAAVPLIALILLALLLLGCGLAIYGNRASGNTGSAFMYTGLITAVSSAAIGTMWALLNLFFDKKKNREEELHRFEAYGEYLITSMKICS